MRRGCARGPRLKGASSNSGLKFKPAYNPYTEPSMEIFGYHPLLKKTVELGDRSGSGRERERERIMMSLLGGPGSPDKRHRVRNANSNACFPLTGTAIVVRIEENLKSWSYASDWDLLREAKHRRRPRAGSVRLYCSLGFVAVGLVVGRAILIIRYNIA